MIKFYLSTDNYKDHFKCNLQECDCLYERNDFEKSILAINSKKTTLKDVALEVPHCSDLKLQKLNDAKEIGPKLTQFNKRFEMVRLSAVNLDEKSLFLKNAGKVLNFKNPLN